ncbi:hypothetical protein M2359_000819 [Gordonia amarae]|uniref:Uncharacterized protein n=1 Tax=Gordonia amarae NBRC 15530 TaxID=1075090 RepID=G7GMZ1_9ACTN|nr:hypothetical protein [Gordonia amarae]GAB04966.1 hypothetical protein GOAMR_25_00020 [Gordonia amarae NBRC 15530]
MLAQEGAPLAFGHAAPDSEFDAIVEGVGSAFELDGAVSADGGGFALGCAADEQFVGVSAAASGLGNPYLPIFSDENRRCRHPPTLSFALSQRLRGARVTWSPGVGAPAGRNHNEYCATLEIECYVSHIRSLI